MRGQQKNVVEEKAIRVGKWRQGGVCGCDNEALHISRLDGALFIIPPCVGPGDA